MDVLEPQFVLVDFALKLLDDAAAFLVKHVRVLGLHVNSCLLGKDERERCLDGLLTSDHSEAFPRAGRAKLLFQCLLAVGGFHSGRLGLAPFALEARNLFFLLQKLVFQPMARILHASNLLVEHLNDVLHHDKLLI